MSRIDRLPPELVRETVDYDPETGVFTLRSSPKEHCIGNVLGALDHKGYVRFSIKKTAVMAHRVAWVYCYGYWPREQIDHINGDRSDNRIANLRECTNAENRQNLKREGYGVSGHVGVHKGYGGKWVASIGLSGKRMYLGIYEQLGDAISAYEAAKAETHLFVTTGVSSLGVVT